MFPAGGANTALVDLVWCALHARMKTQSLLAALVLSACSPPAQNDAPLQSNDTFNIAARSESGDVEFHLTGASLDKAFATMCARARCDVREHYRAELNISDGHVGYVFYHKNMSLRGDTSPFVLAFICSYQSEPMIRSSGRPPPPPSPPPPEPMPECNP